MSIAELKHLSVKEVDGVAVVDFVKSQLLFASDVVEEIGKELHSLRTDRGYQKILLDFTHVQYVSSTMLAQLTTLEQEVEHAKGKLKLCGLGPVLKDTFRISHLERIFAIYDDVEAALKSAW
jgi:anti-sigma B factor antagonist